MPGVMPNLFAYYRDPAGLNPHFGVGKELKIFPE